MDRLMQAYIRPMEAVMPGGMCQKQASNCVCLQDATQRRARLRSSRRSTVSVQEHHSVWCFGVPSIEMQEVVFWSRICLD